MTTPPIDEQIARQKRMIEFFSAVMNPESKECMEAILATLQSIKDAGDDVVEPECYTCGMCGLGEMVTKQAYDALLSAYKRVCVERDALANLNKEKS